MNREPTPDEITGMSWWNGLSLTARTHWMKIAGDTGVAADAWASFKAKAGYQLVAYRSYGGIAVEGTDYVVSVTPGSDGRLHVGVVAKEEVTGYDRRCSAGSEDVSALYYPAHGITIIDDALQCYSDNSDLPGYKEGFALQIEPHMAQELRSWLPRLAAASGVTALVIEDVDRQLGLRKTPHTHMHGFTREFVARVVLDRIAPAEALRLQSEGSWEAEDAEFVATLQHQSVQTLLAPYALDAPSSATRSTGMLS